MGWTDGKAPAQNGSMVRLLVMSEFLHSTVLIETEEGKVATGLIFQHEDHVLLLTAAHAVPDSTEARLRMGRRKLLDVRI